MSNHEWRDYHRKAANEKDGDLALLHQPFAGVAHRLLLGVEVCHTVGLIPRNPHDDDYSDLVTSKEKIQQPAGDALLSELLQERESFMNENWPELLHGSDNFGELLIKDFKIVVSVREPTPATPQIVRGIWLFGDGDVQSVQLRFYDDDRPASATVSTDLNTLIVELSQAEFLHMAQTLNKQYVSKARWWIDNGHLKWIYLAAETGQCTK